MHGIAGNGQRLGGWRDGWLPGLKKRRRPGNAFACGADMNVTKYLGFITAFPGLHADRERFCALYGWINWSEFLALWAPHRHGHCLLVQGREVV